MNRIYQGRVTNVEIVKGKDGKPEPFDAGPKVARQEWQDALWQHHQLFQDAVNYYIVALASLGQSADSPLTKLRARIAAVWEKVDKQGERRDGMGIALAKRFTLPPSKASLTHLIEIVQDGGFPDAAAAEKVGEVILSKATGATGIRTAGRRLWPQVCDPSFGGNPTGGQGEQLKEYGSYVLSTRLHEVHTMQQLKVFGQECQLGWVALTDPTGAAHSDSKGRLHKSVNHFLKVFDPSLRRGSVNKNSSRIEKWLKEFANAQAELRALSLAVDTAENLLRIPRNNRGDSDKIEALLLFQFQPYEFTAALLRQLFPHEPNAERPASNETSDDSHAGHFSRARGNRQYVFRAFTSFAFFGSTSAADLSDRGWKEFDIAAFKEALTVVNQFNQNVTRRAEKLDGLATRLLAMAGDQAISEYSTDSNIDREIRERLERIWRASKGKPKLGTSDRDEENDEDGPPSFVGDPRIVRLREVVSKDLADEYRLTEGRETPYGLRRRTMKGWGDVKRTWQGIVKADTPFSNEKKWALQESLNKLRTSKPEQIGSHRLFEALIGSKESWRVWRESTDAESEEIARNGWPRDPLDAFRVYCETKETLEGLSRRELNFTPADARHSRRLFSFTDACTSFGKPKGGFKHDLHNLAVTVPIAVKNSQNVFQRTTACVTYSAPRLLRDRIRSTDGHYIQQWVQPMVAALCPQPDSLPCQRELEAAAVELMPDWDKDDRLRFLLNFSMDLEVAAISALVQKERSWRQHFVAWKQGEMLTSLRWPRELDDFLQGSLAALKKHCHWSANPAPLEAAITRFRSLATDDQKDTLLAEILAATKINNEKEKDKKLRGSLAYGSEVLKAAWWRQESLKSFRVLSADLGTRHAASVALIQAGAGVPAQPTTARFIGKAGGQKWFARYQSGKILRLPGEDAETYRHQTRFDVERGESPSDRKHDRAFREELHGSRGRLAYEDESRQFRDILSELGHAELIPEAYVGDAALSKLSCLFSFPEQNDKLLVAMRWTQRHLADLISQHWRLVRPEKAQQTEAALAELGEQKRYPDVGTMAGDPARRAELIQFMYDRIGELRGLVQKHLLALTERILPLRERGWEFVPHPQDLHFPGCHLLRSTERGTGSKKKKLPGQRGLSTARIEQLSELRRRWQSLNQSLRRAIGEPPLTAGEMRANPIPDPCPDILRKLDDIREQRVNQTAHLILAEALGVQLREPEKPKKERQRADIHGEYKAARAPVDFIVLENLMRYKATQGRAKSENSRLMQWCHRAVVGKIKELAEPFGIPVLETPAAYSSRFCSMTGIAGFRAVEVSLGDREDYRWRKLLCEADEKLDAASDDAKKAKELLAMLEQINVGRCGKELHTLLAPQIGGPIFVTATPLPHPAPNPKRKQADAAVPPMQSDINAAINLALRGIADPACADIHHRIRTKREEGAGVYQTRETRRFGQQQPIILVRPGDSLPKERNPNLFYDPWQVADFDRAKLGDGISSQFIFASGRGLWKKVNDSAFQWQRVREINQARLADWGIRLNPIAY